MAEALRIAKGFLPVRLLLALPTRLLLPLVFVFWLIPLLARLLLLLSLLP
jgi:hypothetical protein